MDIIKKLDLTVNFGSHQLNVGQSEWEMMTFNEKNHWVLPLVPTACAYAKLNEYFAKLRGLEIEVPQVHCDTVGNLSAQKVGWEKQQRMKSKMGSSKNGDFGNGDMIQKTIARLINTISGYSGGRGYLGNLRGIGNLYNLESNIGNLKGEKENMGSKTNVAEIEEWEV